MISKRTIVHSLALYLAPVAVAAWGWSWPGALLVVAVLLVWRWLLVLSTFVSPPRQAELELLTISASHFVEKVRWNMDAAGIDYVEKPAAGSLSAFYLGRTVPRLRIRTGAVCSEIGNSREILRYLWGAFGESLGERAEHLRPTAERVDFERRIDRCGVNLQVWVYHYLLRDKELTLHAWGCNNPAIPAWQRLALRVLFPVQALLIRRSFRITPDNVDKARQHIESLLEEVDTRLADGRVSILGGDTPNYTDYAFAAISGLWLQPDAYGGGKADAVRIDQARANDGLRSDVSRWCQDYPRVTAWVRALYADARRPAAAE